MLSATFSTVLVFATVAYAGTAAFAGDVELKASTAYQLSIGNPDAFRLADRGAYALAPEPITQTAIPEQLANLPFAVQIDSAARRAALDPALVHALIYVESRYNPVARSPKGAIGLMQVLPETAARYGVTDSGRSPEANLKAGTLYLSDLMQLFDRRVDLALAAYNAGENAVLRYGQRIPPYRETQQYVPAVLAKYREWQEASPVAAPAPTRIQYMPGTSLGLDFLRTTGHR